MKKHLLNFEPTVKYRTGSRFIFRSCVATLFSIPLLLGLQMTYVTIGDYHLAEVLTEQLQEMRQRFDQSKQRQAGEYDLEGIRRKQDRAKLLTQLLRPTRLSWAGLLDQLESAVPADVRCTAIRIAPAPTHRVYVEAEACQTEAMTGFWRRLIDHPRFVAPFVEQHQVTPDGRIRFTLETTYFPPREDRLP